MELTAAGLFRIFTGFPFNHYTERLREPMLGKDTYSIAANQTKNTVTKQYFTVVMFRINVYF
jgi:hypothetical protein